MIPIVGEISPQFESVAKKGGSSVLVKRTAPDKPSTTRTMFEWDTTMTNSWEYPLGVNVIGFALNFSLVLKAVDHEWTNWPNLVGSTL